MKIYSLEFVSTREGSPERIWHTNRRALERYSKTLENGNHHVRGIRSYELPTPLTEARIVAFLNTHCADFLPPTSTGRTPSQRRKRRTPGVGPG